MAYFSSGFGIDIFAAYYWLLYFTLKKKQGLNISNYV